MLMKNLNSRLFSNNYLKLSKKMIYYNPKAPEHEDYFTEVKQWLKTVNPKLLCVYVTNQWNPISRAGESGYNDFVRKNSKSFHLKIDADKQPQLKWFFDFKMEPSLKILYHGANVKTLGGCNFEIYEKNLNRIFDHIHSNALTGQYDKEFEMPYYKWEHDLKYFGIPEDSEYSGSFFMAGFRGQFSLREVPDDKFISHERMKK